MNVFTSALTNCNFTQWRRLGLALSMLMVSGVAGLLLLLWPATGQAQGTVSVRQTIGTTPNLCASTAAIAVTAGTRVYFCATITNQTNTTLTQHRLDFAVPAVGFTQRVTLTAKLLPNASLVVNTPYLSSINLPVSLSAIASSSLTSIVTVVSSNEGGSVSVSDTDQAVAVIGTVGSKLVQTVGKSSDQCGTAKALLVTAGETVYYCLAVTNTGSLTLVNHLLVDQALGITFTFPSVLTTTPRSLTSDNLKELGSSRGLNTRVDKPITNTVSLTSYTAEGIAVTAQDTTYVVPGTLSTVVTNTIEALPNSCGRTTTMAVVTNSVVYYCLHIKNTGTVPLRAHTITVPQLGIDQVVTKTLFSGQVMTVTSSTIPALKRNITAGIASILTVQSRTTSKLSTSATATANVTLGTTAVAMSKYPQKDGNSCAKSSSLSVTGNEAFYYCLVVLNNGQLPLVTHAYEETIANVKVTGRFSYTLAAGARMTVTNQFLANTVKVNSNLGPFRITANTNNVLTFIARTATNAVASTTGNAQVNYTPTTPTSTAVPTAIPTFTLIPTLSPTVTPTPFPTPTATNVVISVPPTPTSPYINVIQTPTPGAFAAAPAPFNSPLETPFVPTPDFVATTFALTAEAATQTALMFQPTSPLPTLTETATPPLPLFTATPVVESPTPTAVALVNPTPTFAPIVSTPEPLADYLNLMAKVLTVSTVTLGWIWFLVGSIIFFAAAGIFAGLAFRQQEDRRYATMPDEETLPLLDEPMGNALSSAGSLYYMTDEEGDGYTVASSSARYQAQREERPRPPATRPTPPDELEGDDFWPASLR